MTWTKLRGGLWHGVERGHVVAVVERVRDGFYMGVCKRTKAKFSGGTAETVRALIDEEFNESYGV